MDSKTRPLSVFICHGSEDKTAVRELYSKLREDGIQVWLDEEDLLPGQDWNDQIRLAVRQCDAILICLSSKSVRKEGYIQKEILLALDAANEKPEGTIFIIPITLDGCELPRRLTMWQYVDYRDDNSYSRILRSLRMRADELSTAHRPGKLILPQPRSSINSHVAESTNRETLGQLDRKNIFVSKRLQIIHTLEQRYTDRYKQKLDDRITLNLHLRFTEQGTTRQHARRYFSKDGNGLLVTQSELRDVIKRHRYLLIVGSPGAGKTTILLNIAISLLHEALANRSMPVPIIFNLASWWEANTDLDQWLEDMLVLSNNFSRRLAKKVIKENLILPLFDGFDEVGHSLDDRTKRESLRSACLASINDFMAKHEPDALVICSRVDEYDSTAADAPVKAELVIEPLDVAQVKQALELLSRNLTPGIHHPFASITAAQNLLHWMEKNSVFARLLQTPFYFNLALQTLFTQTRSDSLPQDATELSNYLIGSFVDMKLRQVSEKAFPSSEKTKKWLSWLAQILRNKNEVVFDLSTLQPSMLRAPNKYRFVFGFSAGFMVAALATLVLILDRPLRGLEPAPFDFTLMALVGGIGVLCGLVIGSLGYCGALRLDQNFTTKDLRQWKFSKLGSMRAWINTGKFLVNGLFKGLKYGFIIGLAFGVLTSVGAGSLERFMFFLILGPVMGLTGGLCFGLVAGLLDQVSTISDFVQTSNPLQKLRSGLLLHAVSWSIVLSLTLFAFIFRGSLIQKAISFVLYLAVLALTVGAVSTPFFKHIVLRYCLTRQEGAIPLRYVAFLNYATRLRILERDGGQWRFRHQILQDHFADMSVPDSIDVKYFY